MTPHDLERERRTAFLMGKLDPILRELHRIYRPGRFFLLQMIENGKGKRLLYQADAILAELARLHGEEHTPLPPIRYPKLPGHPLAWIALQWLTGIWNAYSMIDHAFAGAWIFAVLSLVCLVVCLHWRMPPFHLARQGKWNE